MKQQCLWRSASKYIGLGLCVTGLGVCQLPTSTILPMKDIDITRGRPLQHVVYSVENRLNSAVGYEQGSPEQHDMFVSGATLGGRAKPTAMYPKVEHLHVHFVEDEVNPLHALRAAADAYDDGTPSHKFVTQQKGSMVLLYPAENSISMRSISIPEGSRTLDETVETIAQTLSQLVGRAVKIWTPPFSNSTLYKFGADNETVAEVLTRYTQLLGGTGSYWLIYDPRPQCYFLSLRFQQHAPISLPVPTTTLEDLTPKTPVQNNPFYIKK